jgi:hypothetical protein
VSARDATYLNGARIFKTADDDRRENDVAGELARAWGCTLRSFSWLSPVDWWAERDGRIVGLLELKCRTCSSSTYPTVFLSLRKWLALTLASLALDVPGLFVVRFTDGVWWVPVARVDARAIRVAGRAVVRQPADVEPLIDVPVASMARLELEGELW